MGWFSFKDEHEHEWGMWGFPYRHVSEKHDGNPERVIERRMKAMQSRRCTTCGEEQQRLIGDWCEDMATGSPPDGVATGTVPSEVPEEVEK